MGIPTPVIRALDIMTVITPTPHRYFGSATGFAAEPMGLAIETPFCPMYWFGGLPTGSHKIAFNVKNHNLPVVQTKHDLGPLLPHLEIVPAPDDVLTIVHILKSKCVVHFQNGEVQAQGAPLGSMFPFIMNALACSDIASIPAGMSFTSMVNGSWHETSWTDFIAGWTELLITVAIEFIAFRKTQRGPAPTSIAAARIEPFMPDLKGDLISAGTSLASSIGGAVVRWVGREYFGYQGPITVGVSGGPGSLGSVGAQCTSNADGSWSVQGTAARPVDAREWGAQYGEDAQGNRSFQTSNRSLTTTTQSTVTESRGADGSSQWIGESSETSAFDGSTTTTQSASPTDYDTAAQDAGFDVLGWL